MPELIGITLKEKQDDIIRILGFDYETFRNTANFEQGSSDSFSTLPPKEAKAVVMKILQLNKFETLEKTCRERYKELYDRGLQVKTELEYMQTNTDWQEEDVTPYTTKKIELETKLTQIQKELDLINSQSRVVYQIEELEKMVNKFESLDSCPTCKQKVTDSCKHEVLKEQKQSIVELKKTVDYNIINNTKLIRDSYSTVTTELANTVNTIKSIVDKKEKLEKLRVGKDKLETELNSIKTQLQVYKNLVEAFGKNGIPTYIIRNVIPEITGITNDILHSLEVEFQVEIDTEKALKTGGISDTLDIFIRNGKYVRKYYNFSGGQKFLIDLALRIALSIILLRRKGTSNSTLIIDEGLGSLDRETSLKVVQLINLIQERYGFKKVLMITHVSEIQDALTNKIEVVQRDNFSEVKV